MQPFGQRRVFQIRSNSRSGCELDGEELGVIAVPAEELPVDGKVGDAVEVIVLPDPNGNLTGSLRVPAACAGEFGVLKVNDVRPRVGAYLDWGHGRELFLPAAELPKQLRPGDTLVVVVLYDATRRQMVATSRLERHLQTTPPPYVVGQRVRVIVAAETPLGFKAIVENAYWGLLYKSNLGVDLPVGSEFDAFVKQVRADSRVDLQLDATGYKRVLPLADRILETLQGRGGKLNLDDDSSPEEIRSAFGVSKKAFKQAVGRLFRERRIRFVPGGIEILKLWILSFLFFQALGLAGLHAETIRFGRDIRPLLADACFKCHGQDPASRKGGLRLDVKEAWGVPAKSGALAIVPKDSGKSELLRRVMSSDPDLQMPPPETKRRLTAEQVELLRRWIDAGATYEGHWAFQPIQQPEPPVLSSDASTWVRRNPVDVFIQSELTAHGLAPAAEASRLTLLRRLTLDLTGLPPSPNEVTAFISDTEPDAYEHVVERLLHSPRYGERMAQDWLDVARFADSNGYQVDRDREMWAYRDWVVRAFNRNMPFDQFTREQLAGDLLPGTTADQLIASGFHRNHMLNEEGGIIAEEFLNEYCADRVETTATAWLGLTFNCARCHDHKYDPFTQRDFYSLYAFFNGIDERGVGDYGASIRRNAPPFLFVPETPEALEYQRASDTLETAVLQEKGIRAHVLNGFSEWTRSAREAVVGWESVRPNRVGIASGNGVAGISNQWITLQPTATGVARLEADLRIPLSNVGGLRLQFQLWPLGSPQSTSGLVSLRELRWQRLDTGDAVARDAGMFARSLPGTLEPSEWNTAVDGNPNSAWRLPFATNASPVIAMDAGENWTGSGQVVCRLVAEFQVDGSTNGAVLAMRVDATATPREWLLSPEISGILQMKSADRTEADIKRCEEFLLRQSGAFVAAHRDVERLEKVLKEKDLARPVTWVMKELPSPRATHILQRGQYDRPGDGVAVGTPAHLPPMEPTQPRNRLGLAEWLVARSNPLTARVQVNRLWQQFFGIGLVRTAEDFGTQGELPTHPALLDWLAADFMDNGWDTHRLIRWIVTSAAYRQSSEFVEPSASADPENRWLARGPRGRLSAEAIRDQALAVSGLLVGQLGGPAVRPYHPPGLYEQVVAGSSSDTYVQDHGASLYRRTLYTYWKRSVPNPALLLFDRPFRESCTLRRARTSTPLQALNLMNDPTYVEAARVLAMYMERFGEGNPSSGIRSGFERALCRPPTARELEVLRSGWERSREAYARNPAAAEKLLAVGESRAVERRDPVLLAAYTVTASTLLNLDELLNKE